MRFSSRAFRFFQWQSLLLCFGMTSVGVCQEPPKGGEGYADTPRIPGQVWRVHDKYRPQPPVIKPADAPMAPPSDAIMLFDGNDLSKWKKSGSDDAAAWKVQDGYMEVVGKSGAIETKNHYGDVQLHIEWASPEQPKGKSQGRGNSGVIFMGRYEVQVLDSSDNPTYADGQAASIYGQYAPQVNASRGPGQWQAYDIVFEAPRFDGDKLTKPAKVTVFHNGVLVQHAREMIGQMAHQGITPYAPHPTTGPLVLQDHGDPVRFRNIWVRSLRDDVAPWLEFEGKSGPGKGKKVVLLSGDEEYRSEEAVPMLAKILSERHGFNSVALFSINPETGTVDPNYSSNIPGTFHLDNADVMILDLRFRELPDWQMKPIVEFVERGGAVIGLRTSTHAFKYPKNSTSPYAKWSYDHGEWKGGFGQQVLGETWVSHHGKHKIEAARGVIPKDKASDPILRGVDDVFVPSDVYGVVHLPADANVLMLGQIISGMNPTDPPVTDKRNDPMMPMVWTRTYKTESGKECRVFTTTMGASIDLTNESLRRMVINATYWAAGLEKEIPAKADVEYGGNYKPTFFGFQNNPKSFFKDKLIKPQDYLVK
ncbi:MAG: family 16 glycoside hydrolase [Pirellulales bacterium]